MVDDAEMEQQQNLLVVGEILEEISDMLHGERIEVAMSVAISIFVNVYSNVNPDGRDIMRRGVMEGISVASDMRRTVH